MTDEQRSRWFSLRAKSETLLDRPAPAPTRDLFRPDALERWAAGMPTVEPEPEPPGSPEIRRTAPAPAPVVDVAAEIEAALEVERTFLLEVMGESLGEMLRDMRRESADELAAEVRRLWAVVSELQCTIAALTRIGVTGKAGQVLDLPALPRREMN
jgi:hypothetical protein